ncbi:hypothetical protein S40285_10363 [Stachybotrys chlorohalonatus IBT 40285]|uniref:N-acetyltransferase ESCO zinc-finger domain-containing protein n=1 Tax=Stachybotrys chlorohalonatus (strain IBT 40285) TaxID=1283841 RepID=A0A084R0P1_STAC4|nr:hypothetical protein S40285_10363 [Stachybotrys chlorohalonata IBT 40285]
MTTSSPETKPGMSHLPRKRDKPLRTYGRRSDSRGEPPSKRPRISPERAEPAPTAVERGEAAVFPSVVKVEQPLPELPKKGSIMNYFQRIASSSPATTGPSSSTDTPPASGDTPPSSPPAAEHTRKRRRTLRIRSIQPPSSDPVEPYTEEEEETPSHSGHSHIKPHRGGINKPETSDMCSKPHATQEAPSIKHAKRKKTKQVALVQTTLSLSAQPSFSECRICDTVWNPLYPDDVKYHSKRHAAVLRTLKKRQIEL